MNFKAFLNGNSIIGVNMSDFEGTCSGEIWFAGPILSFVEDEVIHFEITVWFGVGWHRSIDCQSLLGDLQSMW